MENLMYFQDENGNELPLMMVDTFDVSDNSYALFVTPEDQLKENEQPNFYIMRIIYENDEIVNFEMPTDEEMEKVVPVISERMEHQHSCGGSCSGCHGSCGCED